jgi:hypothetical protein
MSRDIITCNINPHTKVANFDWDNFNRIIVETNTILRVLT